MACPSGKVQHSTLASDQPDSNGRFGFSSCGDCPSGSATLTDHGSCEQCPAGKYQTESRGNYPIPHSLDDSDHYASDLNFQFHMCQQCSTGEYVDVAGRTACVLCSSGTQSNGARTQCEACDAGTYSNPPLHITTCRTCGTGQYQPEPSSSSCTACGGSVDSSRTHCEPCAAGEFAVSGSGPCQTCPMGRYQPSAGLRSSCIACAAGQSSDEARTGCEECSAGKSTDASSGGTFCTNCLRGQYQPYTGQSQCITCPAGQISNIRRTTCENCPSGQVLVTEISQWTVTRSAYCPDHLTGDEWSSSLETVQNQCLYDDDFLTQNGCSAILRWHSNSRYYYYPCCTSDGCNTESISGVQNGVLYTYGVTQCPYPRCTSNPDSC
eukprot:COSAG05_NODE_2202_length_3405_cov_29.546884_1_plen_380_part_00